MVQKTSASLIGAKVLSSKMMKCTFPYTDSVLATIEHIRSNATEVQGEFCEKLRTDPDESVMKARSFNNVISILGSRGTGKTSVIMTLQQILKYGKKAWETDRDEERKTSRTNIILPMLVPQDFAKGQTLLSWIIVQLLEEGKEAEKDRDKNCQVCGGKRDPLRNWIPKGKNQINYDPLKDCRESLTRAFELRYKSEKTTAMTGDGQVYRYMEEAKRDSELVVQMLKMISMLADYYRSSAACLSDNAEPLFFFFIDDLDLAPERSQEVLQLVLRFLQHPNVVVLCGWNQELYQSNLCIELLRNQGVLDEDLLNTNFGYDDVFMKRQRKAIPALDSARRLVVDNLKKAFPPAQRYEIRSLNTVQRAFFPISPDGELNAKQENCFFVVMENALLRRNKDTHNNQVPFLRNKNGEYLYVYTRIFDNKARGMMNVYRAFEMLGETLKNWDHQEELNLLPDIRVLLDTILFSNTRFVRYRRGIRDLVRIDALTLSDNPVKSQCKYFCNYNDVSQVLEAFRREEEREEEYDYYSSRYHLERFYNYFPSVVIDVYILLNFMENILRYLSRMPMYEHGGEGFSEALNDVNKSIEISLKADDMLSNALAVGGISTIPLFPDCDNFRFNLRLLDRYEREGFEDRRYEFAGSESYIHLSNAVYALVAETTTEPRTRSSKTSQALIAELKKLKGLYPDWMGNMEQVFAALLFSEKNVKRLSKYRSFLRQGVFEYRDELLSHSNDLSTEEFQKHVNEYTSDAKVLKDSELDRLVSCIRQTDKLKNEFQQYILNSEKYSEKNLQKVDIPLKAKSYFVLFEEYMEKELAPREELSDYEYKLRRVRAVQRGREEEKEANKTSLNEVRVPDAHYCAEQNIEMLLRLLHQALKNAFLMNYLRRKGAVKQMEYLLSASDAVATLRKKWNLGFGSWTENEDDAIKDLESILQTRHIWTMYYNTRELGRFGKQLEISSRDAYMIRLRTIKDWMEREMESFLPDEQRRIAIDLRVLEEAPQRIRRLSDVEERLHNVLTTFGELIAEGCAYVGSDPSLLSDKTSEERQKVSWPVIEANRNRFDIWEKLIESEIAIQTREEQTYNNLFDRI